MDSDETNSRYRPVCKYLCIGDKEYAVLDPELAQQRATQHFTEALSILESKDICLESEQKVNQLLTLATDFGSKDAPYILALRVLDEDTEIDYRVEEVVVFLKLAAEREHPEAALQMACCYAAMNKYPAIESAARKYFASFSASERRKLAEYYFQKAVQLDYQPAIEELVISYAYGRGYFQKDAQRFITLCESQVDKRNQGVMLGYGAWLAGMTVEGKDPLPDVVTIPRNSEKALTCLLMTSCGQNLQMARHALKLICCGLEREVWTASKLKKRLVQSAKAGNQLLSLYFAWYSTPQEDRNHLLPIFKDFELPMLAKLVDVDQQAAVNYLDSAFFGADEDISEVAKEILSQVFGRCFMDAEGKLVWEEQTA